MAQGIRNKLAAASPRKNSMCAWFYVLSGAKRHVNFRFLTINAG
jgi:hypothetical protein